MTICYINHINSFQEIKPHIEIYININSKYNNNHNELNLLDRGARPH